MIERHGKMQTENDKILRLLPQLSFMLVIRLRSGTGEKDYRT
jgi:hypothetical protein